MSSGPVAIARELGYILSGPIEDRKFSNVTTSTCAMRPPPITKSMANVITKSLNKIWDTESLGVVKESFGTPMKFAYDIMELDIKWSYQGKRNTLIFQIII